MQPAEVPARLWFLGMLCSILPDADVIGFKFGIPYEHVLGHRGFSHSFVFAALLAGLVVFTAFRAAPWQALRLRLLLFFFLATASHGVLDAMTNGGLGIAFFSPFDNTRYFLPLRPIQVSPIGVQAFFSPWGLRVMFSEILWIWLPVLGLSSVFIAGRWLWFRRHNI